jgi:hypothetical protein
MGTLVLLFSKAQIGTHAKSELERASVFQVAVQADATEHAADMRSGTKLKRFVGSALRNP